MKKLMLLLLVALINYWLIWLYVDNISWIVLKIENYYLAYYSLVAILESFIKLIPFLLALFLIDWKHDFKRTLLFMSCFTFAMIEHYLYIEWWLDLSWLVLRVLFTTPMHMLLFFSVYTLWFYRWISVTILLHSLYDVFLTVWIWFFIFISLFINVWFIFSYFEWNLRRIDIFREEQSRIT